METGPRASEEDDVSSSRRAGRRASSAERAGLVPSYEELVDALGERTDGDGALRPGIAGELGAEKGWSGRVPEILALVSADAETMGYVAGGHRPEEVAEAVVFWAASPLSLEEIASVLSCGGWDPDPFVVLSDAGLLDGVLHLPDGSCRRVRGELAGAWVSDTLALADDSDVIERARAVIDGSFS